MSKILSIKNLDIFIDTKNKKDIVQKVNLDIFKGQTVALVGESGSGKSMLAHSILQLLPKSANFKVKGDIFFENKELLNFCEDELLNLRGNEISMIFQEPMAALNPLHKVKKQIAEIIQIHKRVSKEQVNKEVLNLLEKVELHKYGNIEKIANSYSHELSGGQRQRVMIAMALANKPKLLIADEPTTALDLTIQYQILNLLKKLQDEYKMSILLITHDLAVVRKYADFIYVINKGEIVEKNLKDELFAKPQNEYTKLLLSNDLKDNSFDEENKKEILRVNNLELAFPIKKGLFKRVVGEFKAVDKVSFSLKEQECFGIIGESGSGKSTLCQALLRLLDSKGEINFLQKDLNSLNKANLQKLRVNMQIVFQDPFNSLNPRMSIFSIISEGLDIHTNLTKEQKKKEVLKILEVVNMPKDSIYRYPHEFSGGQRQRIAVARALILKPKLLIFDEPTSALDRQVQFALLRLLKKIQKEYKLTYIFISHDLEVIESICNKIAVMKEGKFVEQASTQQLFTSAKHPYTKALIEASR